MKNENVIRRLYTSNIKVMYLESIVQVVKGYMYGNGIVFRIWACNVKDAKIQFRQRVKLRYNK